jgi:hypothetical protein
MMGNTHSRRCRPPTPGGQLTRVSHCRRRVLTMCGMSDQSVTRDEREKLRLTRLSHGAG